MYVSFFLSQDGQEHEVLPSASVYRFASFAQRKDFPFQVLANGLGKRLERMDIRTSRPARSNTSQSTNIAESASAKPLAN